MVADGVWTATRPDVEGHAGFRLNALVSTLPNASWGRLAAEFVVAKNAPDTLQVFVNTILAEGWREAADEVHPDDLAARAEAFGLEAIPAKVLVVTAGVDVQHDRLEVTLVGHGRDAAFVLGHLIVWGGPGDDSTWVELDELLRSTWQHPSGGRLKVDAAIVDSGDGSWTQRVYEFCRARSGRRILAGKGVAGPRPPLTPTKTRGLPLFLIGVDGLKGQVLQRLTRGRTIRFSADLPPDYWQQVSSERRVVRYSRGQPAARFERIPGRRAEALDCLVYALAARHGVNANLEVRERDLSSFAAASVRATTVRSTWLDRD